MLSWKVQEHYLHKILLLLSLWQVSMYQLNKMKTEQQPYANIKASFLGDREMIVGNINVNEA